MRKRENPFSGHKDLIVAIAAAGAAIIVGFSLFSLQGCSNQRIHSTPGGTTGTSLPTASTVTEGNPPVTTLPTTSAAIPTTIPTESTGIPATESTTVPTEPAGPQPLEHHVTPNHFRAEDFTYDENGYIACLEQEYWLGIDVSAHQGEIDWEQVADAGIQFAIVRIGFRGWGSAGILKADKWGQVNLDGATAAGLKVGVYIYSQAITVEEAEEEARFVLQLLDGRELDMPVVFDWETPSADGARTRDLDSETLNACAMAFCRVIEDAGYRPMVYFNQKQAKYMYDLTALQKAGYDFWIAMYTDAMTYKHCVQLWQYTSHGKVPGIDTRVDMDLYFPNL